jgi:hypothetical protein
MSAELRCSNCNNRLDPTDKFCRECGLPTVHRAEAQRRAAEEPPNAAELRRAMDVAADPTPFAGGPGMRSATEGAQPELTTGGVLKVTSPTFATQLAASTLIMVGVIVVLVVVGIALIVLALRV